MYRTDVPELAEVKLQHLEYGHVKRAWHPAIALVIRVSRWAIWYHHGHSQQQHGTISTTARPLETGRKESDFRNDRE